MHTPESIMAKNKKHPFHQNNRNTNFQSEKGILTFTFLHFLSNQTEAKRIFHKLKHTQKKVLRKENGTSMLFTAGLFKRFKCFWTSSLCLETLNLAAQDSETKPHKQKITAKPLLVLPLLLN